MLAREKRYLDGFRKNKNKLWYLCFTLGKFSYYVEDAMVGRSWELDVAKVGLKAELWVGGVLWDYILEGLTGRKL